MRSIWLGGLAVLAPALAVLHFKEDSKERSSSKTFAIAGTTWHEGLDQAKLIARERQRPILLLQMFGSLDEEFC